MTGTKVKEEVEVLNEVLPVDEFGSLKSKLFFYCLFSYPI